MKINPINNHYKEIVSALKFQNNSVIKTTIVYVIKFSYPKNRLYKKQ